MKDNNLLRGANHQSTKTQNRALILKLICTGSAVSRIDLSRQTGLSKMAITNLVNELLSEGYVVEGEGREMPDKGTATGRRPVVLSPDTESRGVIGLYISRDYATAILSNFKCHILEKFTVSFAYEETPESFCEKLISLIGDVMASPNAGKRKLEGIGVACIGPLDSREGVILEPPNFHMLKSIAVGSLLKKTFNLPVYVDNDMNAAALAERLYGKGKDVSHFVYVGITNGIGAGIISGEQLFSGERGFSGEIGHTTIHYEGPKCACGNNGCLELYASLPVIVSQAANALDLGMESMLKNYKDLSWEAIVECAQKEDKLALSLIDRICLYGAIGLVSVVNIFDPQVIYLGHEFALAGDMAAQKLEGYIKDKTMSSRYKTVPVEISAFGEKAPLTGASALVLDRLFKGI